MPEVTISVGGRDYEVACQEGEEHFLQSAALLLDQEASVLSEQIGRMPEARMLLMAGLMLADKTAGIEERLQALETKLAEANAEIEDWKSMPKPAPERVEVPVVPQWVKDSLAEVAAHTEAMAAALEERVGISDET